MQSFSPSGSLASGTRHNTQSKKSIAKHLLNQRVTQTQATNVSIPDAQSMLDSFHNDTLIIKSIKQSGDAAVVVPTAQIAARDMTNTRFRMGSRRVSRFAVMEKRGSTEIGTNTIGVVTTDDFVAGKESSLLVGEDTKMSIGAPEPQTVMLPTR